jgi:rubrerythrin
MKTPDNLKEAFAGESQANRRYLAFARKADLEGHPQIAKLFRAVAAAETIHAHNHLGVMDGIGGTKANLEAAISGETFEFTKMYPGFITDATTEGANKARWTFDMANKVEEIHAVLFKEALAAMSTEPGPDYTVCDVCGYTVAGEPPDRCPVCGAPHTRFTEVE